MTKKKNQTKDEEIVKNDMREKNMRERENTLKVSEEERVSENNARKEREREHIYSKLWYKEISRQIN